MVDNRKTVNLVDTSSLKAIDRNIRNIAVKGAALNELIQQTAVDIIRHAQAHGDCSRALKLVQAMPVSFRRTKVVKFFAEYSPIQMDVKKGKVGLRKDTSPHFVPFNVDGAIANPWFEDKPGEEEKIPSTFTVASIQNMIYAVANKMAKDAKLNSDSETTLRLAEDMAKRLRLVASNVKDVEAAETNNDNTNNNPPIPVTLAKSAPAALKAA